MGIIVNLTARTVTGFADDDYPVTITRLQEWCCASQQKLRADVADGVRIAHSAVSPNVRFARKRTSMRALTMSHKCQNRL